jgi:hypothetical protein
MPRECRLLDRNDNSSWNPFFDQQFDELGPRLGDTKVDKEYCVGTRAAEEQYRYLNTVSVLCKVPRSMAASIDI